jgi:hypothetical protein
MLRRTFSALAAAVVVAACESSAGPASTSPDGGVSASDAGSEAAPDAAKPPAVGCSTTLIETFDGGYSPRWTEKTTPGGKVELIADELVATRTAESAEGHARLELIPGVGLPKAARLRFKVLVSAVTGGFAEVGCQLIAVASLDTWYGVYLDATEGSLLVDDAAQASAGVPATTEPAVPIGGFMATKWYDVELELRDLTPSGAHAVAKVDGATLFERDVTFPAVMSGLWIGCGVPLVDPNVAATVRVDDVTVERCD